MIELIMYFGIGFLTASLLALVSIPLVHTRAVRLTMRRVQAGIPLSMAEIQADKDHLRAEFAMSTCRLEVAMEELRTKVASQLAELGNKTNAISHLKLELAEKTAAIFALEVWDRALKDQRHATEEPVSSKPQTVHGMERPSSRAIGNQRVRPRELGFDARVLIDQQAKW